MNDILPFDTYDRPNLYSIDVSVPDDVDTFQLEVLVYAENLKVQRLTIGFNVRRGV